MRKHPWSINSDIEKWQSWGVIFQRYTGFYFSDALVGQTSFSSSGEESETQLDPTNNHCDSPPITTGWTQGKITNSSLGLILIGQIKGQICDWWVFWTGTWGVNVLSSSLPPVCGGPEDGNGLGLCGCVGACVCMCVCAHEWAHGCMSCVQVCMKWLV